MERNTLEQDITIVVAEDRVLVRNLIGLVLHREGYHVLSAADCDEARELCLNHPGELKLLITRKDLPDCKGSDLAKTVLRSRPEIRAIVLSASVAAELQKVVHQKSFAAATQDSSLPLVLRNGISRALSEPDFPSEPLEI